MKTFHRLKELISSLSEDEMLEIMKELKDDSHYKNLFNDVQKMSYEEFIFENKGRKANKSLNHHAEYLEEKIVSYFAKNPNTTLTKKILALNEILFLQDHGIDDLAMSKIAELNGDYSDKDHDWMMVCVLDRFGEKPKLFNNLQYIKLLKFYCSRFAAFGNHNSSPYFDFLRFIEEYRKESASVNLQINTLSDEIYILHDLKKNSVYARKMELILKRAYLISKKYSFVPNRGEVEYLLAETENELIQASDSSFNKDHLFTMTAFYADSILSSEKLIYKINNLNIIDSKTQFLIDEDLINDIVLRIEINRIVMKVFSYNRTMDSNKINADLLLTDFIKLLKKTKKSTETSVFLKTIYLLFIIINKIEKPSTWYKYRGEIESFSNTYYIKILKEDNLFEPEQSDNLFLKILYNYRLRFGSNLN